MAFNNQIQFTYTQGGLNTPPPGIDFISGIVFKSSTTPSGFTWSTPLEILSVSQAESLGIYGNYQDETAATSKITVTATGSAGSTVAISIAVPSINSTYQTVNFGTYTLTSSDASGSLNSLATNLSTFISSQFNTTGYQSGTATGASFSITATVGEGTILNGTTPTITNSGVTVTAAAFSGGVNSVRAEEHYQISEYFRMNPNGQLWVDYETSLGSFAALNTLQIASGNNINQVGVYNVGATTSAGINSDLGALQTQCVTLAAQEAPLVVIYAPNIYSTSNLATLGNLRALSSNYCSTVIEQDGGALGAHLAQMYGHSVPSYGNVLGMVSIGNVASDIGNPINQFNQTNGTELETVAFSNGQLYNTIFTSNYNLLTQLDSYGYIFGRKLANYSGTYVNDNHSDIAITNSYAYMNLNRVINKVQRTVYSALIPFINGGVRLNNDGTININSIAQYKAACKPGLDAMIQNDNISGYPVTPGSSTNGIFINPAQNTGSTGVVQIIVNIVPIAIARSIQVTLNLTVPV